MSSALLRSEGRKLRVPGLSWTKSQPSKITFLLAALFASADVARPQQPSAPKPTGALLSTSVAVISQMEDGSAVGSDARFVPGETIFFSVTVENHKVGPTGKVELNSEIEALDPQGIAFHPKSTEHIKTTLEEEDKDWKPKFRAQLQLPSIAHPGDYRVRYKITDLQSGMTTQGERKFPVTGPDVQTSSELVIRDFGFFRGEEEGSPLSPAAYRPGDTLWARFAITGYKYGPENAIDVAYDVAISNGEGKQLFEQKNAAIEKSHSFYPQPWVPGGMNLNLQSNLRPGAYTVTITARDGVSHTSAAEKHEFRVE